MSRSTATTPTVTASSRKSAPENALAMSAPKAGPPVTRTFRSPGLALSTSARRSVIVAMLSLFSAPVRTGMRVYAARPSADTVAVGGPTGGRSCGATRAVRPARAFSSVALSAAPSARVATRRTGATFEPGRAANSAATRANSALAGTGSPRGGIWASRKIPIAAPSTARKSTRIAAAPPRRRVPGIGCAPTALGGVEERETVGGASVRGIPRR